jgi:hypothetical protein
MTDNKFRSPGTTFTETDATLPVSPGATGGGEGFFKSAAKESGLGIVESVDRMLSRAIRENVVSDVDSFVRSFAAKSAAQGAAALAANLGVGKSTPVGKSLDDVLNKAGNSAAGGSSSGGAGASNIPADILSEIGANQNPGSSPSQPPTFPDPKLISPTSISAQNPLEGNLYTDKDPFAPIAGVTKVANQIDVFAIAHWLRGVSTELGILQGSDSSDRGRRVAKGITFAATQLLLATMNPGDLQVGGPLNQLYNPLSLALSAVPGVRVSTTIGSPNAAAALSLTGEVYTTTMGASIAAGTTPTPAAERLLQMRAGTYKKAVDGSDISKLRTGEVGYVGDVATTPVGSGPTLEKPGLPGFSTTIEQQVDRKIGLGHTNIYTSDTPYGAIGQGAILPLDKLEKKQSPILTPEAVKLNTLFLPKKFPSGLPTVQSEAYTWISKRQFTDVGIGTKGSASPQHVGVKVHDTEDSDGLIKPKNDGTSPLEDSELYMPFSFQDLRKTVDQYLYFRAFLKEGINETFTPDWQTERYYGRVDQIPVYLGTIRSIALSFDVVAWEPSDLPLMYRKLHKLQSMVYPMYDTQGFMLAGPIIRMRVGDLFSATGKRGLPGYISSLDFNYDDGIWNTETDAKIPRKVTVSLGYTVLHDGNPGIYQSTVTFTDEATVKDNVPSFGVGMDLESVGGTAGTYGGLGAGVRGFLGNLDVAKKFGA